MKTPQAGKSTEKCEKVLTDFFQYLKQEVPNNMEKLNQELLATKTEADLWAMIHHNRERWEDCNTTLLYEYHSAREKMLMAELDKRTDQLFTKKD